MKKILSLVIALSIIISIMSLVTLSASAFFGIGASVVAADVNMIKTGLIGNCLYKIERGAK